MTSKTTFNGQVIAYAYTQLDDKLQTESLPEYNITFNYDDFLRRQSMTDVSGTTTYNYDSRDRMTAKQGPEGTLSYTYYNHGELESVKSSLPTALTSVTHTTP